MLGQDLVWFPNWSSPQCGCEIHQNKTQECASFIALYPHDVPETISEWIIYLYVIIHVIIYIYVYMYMHVYGMYMYNKMSPLKR